MECKQCGNESKTMYCGGACRAKHYRAHGQDKSAHAHESAKTSAHAKNDSVESLEAHANEQVNTKLPLNYGLARLFLSLLPAM